MRDPTCDACRRAIEPHETPHLFAGWGFFVAYHPACCPRTLDGDECDRGHGEEAE